MTLVFGPATARISLDEPTAMIRLPEIASASAVGRVWSMVWMEALTITSSGATEPFLEEAASVVILAKSANDKTSVVINFMSRPISYRGKCCMSRVKQASPPREFGRSLANFHEREIL